MVALLVVWAVCAISTGLVSAVDAERAIDVFDVRLWRLG